MQSCFTQMISYLLVCLQVGSYSYEPNAFKYGDKPQSYSVVTVQSRNMWQRNFDIEFDFRTFYPNGILFVALVSILAMTVQIVMMLITIVFLREPKRKRNTSSCCR